MKYAVFGIMYRIALHKSAEEDLAWIKKRDAVNWASIIVLIEEIEANEELRWSLAIPKNKTENFETKIFEFLKSEGLEVWILKIFRCKVPIPYRVIYAFNDEDEICHILAIMERGQHYEEDDDFIARIKKACEELGI